MADKYDREARFAPAILCSAPFVAVGFYMLSQVDLEFWKLIFTLGVGGVTMTYALYQLAFHSCRWAGKYLEEKLFDEGRSFPTTSFLLDNDNTCSADRKVAIIKKLKSDFGIDLKGKTEDSLQNRIVIHEAIGQIRKKFFKKDTLLLQRNIQFGFAKNLTGGSAVAAIVSGLGLIVCSIFSATVASQTLAILLGIYTVMTIVSLWATRFTAKHYAITLFDEFLGS